MRYPLDLIGSVNDVELRSSLGDAPLDRLEERRGFTHQGMV